MDEVTIDERALEEWLAGHSSNLPIVALFSSGGNPATVLAGAWMGLITAQAVRPIEVSRRVWISVTDESTVAVEVAASDEAGQPPESEEPARLADGGSTTRNAQDQDVYLDLAEAADKLRAVLEGPPDQPPMGNRMARQF